MPKSAGYVRVPIRPSRSINLQPRLVLKLLGPTGSAIPSSKLRMRTMLALESRSGYPGSRGRTESYLVYALNPDDAYNVLTCGFCSEHVTQKF